MRDRWALMSTNLPAILRQNFPGKYVPTERFPLTRFPPTPVNGKSNCFYVCNATEYNYSCNVPSLVDLDMLSTTPD